jgi:RNA polymerase sigma factor (sigma-70 family)
VIDVAAMGRGSRAQPEPQPEPPAEPALRLVPNDAYAFWEEIYRHNIERLYRLMFARVGNRADAEDLTAEVFVAALPRLRLDASVGEVRAYLLSVARTVLADHWRRTLGRQITTIDPDVLAEEFAEADSRPATVQRVRRVLDALPDRYRMILSLRFLQSATVREAARQMGISVPNAKVLQYRALRQAARIIEAEGG